MKKIFILLLFFASFLHADYVLYVNSPEEVDSMYAILNAIAKIFGSDNYVSLLKLMFLFGGFVAFYSWVLGAFRDGGKEGGFAFTKFNIGAVALLTLVFSVQTTVWVKSEHFPKYYDSNDSSTYTTGVAVDNIPEVVAYSLYFLNRFGKGLTDMYEVAMNPVGSYSLKDGGYASTLRDDFQLLTNKLGDTDVTLGSAVDALISQCVLIPFSAKGSEGEEKIEELFSSSNIKSTLDNWYNSDVVVGGIKAKDYQVDYQGETWKCGDLWDYIKNEKLTDYSEKAGKYLSRLDSRDLEMLTGLKDVPKSDFDEIAIQSGIVNSVLNNKDLPVGVSYAGGKTQAEFVQQNVGAGYYMSKMLPIMQSLFRALIYAIFPAIIAISLLPGGWNILKNYAKTAVWIELWGVIAAVLNFFLLKYTEHNVAGDITVYSASKMLSETSAMAGMAGYLYLLVPAIAWGIMSGSFTMLQGLGSGVAANFAKNVQTSTVAADSGKMAMKQAVSDKTGEDLSFAEALHYRENVKGYEEGTALGVKVNKGEAAVKELSEYSAEKPFADFIAKKDAISRIGGIPSATGVAGAEARVGGGSLAKGLGDLDQTGDPKNMYNRGRLGAAGDMGKLDTVGVGGAYNIAAGQSAKSLGEFNVAGVDGMKGAGRKAGRDDLAMSALEAKHGTAITSAAFFRANEDTIRSNVRGNMLSDSYHESSEAQRIKTDELPNYNKFDFNGDGRVSSSEANLGASINTLDGKMGLASKKFQQEQMRLNAEKNRNSASSTVRAAQAAGEALYNDQNSATIGAAAAKAGVGAKVENANQRKDSRVLEQLQTQGKDMEDTAVLDSKRMVGDLAQTKTQTDTTGGLITDLVQKKDEIREKIGEMVDKDKSLGFGAREDMKDRMLMTSLAHVGIADGDLTARNLQKDVSKVQEETQEKLRTGLVKTVGQENMNTLNGYSQLLQNRENIAQRLQSATDSKERASLQRALKQYDEVVIPSFENSRDMQALKAKVEEYHSSSEAQSIIKEGQQKLDGVYKTYESMGLIRRDSSGNVQVADTVRTINSLNGEQKALYVEQVKRSLDGLKTSTVGIDGMQLERVDNILGEHITERATATQEWSKTARFNHDIQYYAVQNGWVDRENVAIFNTGVGAVKDMLGMYGFTKVIKK